MRKDVESTGIYRQVTETAETADETRQLFGEHAQRVDDTWNKGSLDTLRAELESQLPVGYPQLQEPLTPAQNDARQALSYLREIEPLWRAILEGAPIAIPRAQLNDLAGAVIAAVQLGALLERLGVRPWERFAAMGVQNERNRSEGPKKRRDKAKRDYADIRETFAAVRREHPESSVEAAVEETATRHGVSESTVVRARREQ